MRQSVDVELSEFAVQALEGEEGGEPERVPARLVRAILYYLSERGSGRAEWTYPAFMRDTKPSKVVELELNVDEKLWSSLEEEAARQGVSTQQMLGHAALFLAADVNSGRFTERILDGIENGNGDAPEGMGETGNPGDD